VSQGEQLSRFVGKIFLIIFVFHLLPDLSGSFHLPTTFTRYAPRIFLIFHSCIDPSIFVFN